MTNKIIIVLSGILLCVTGLLHAQNRDEATDTLAQYVDTVAASKAPAEEDVSEDEEVEDQPASTEKKNDYFLLKSSLAAAPDSVYARRVDDSLKKKWAGDEDFWYANTVFPKKSKKDTNYNEGENYYLFGAKWVETLLWVIIIGAFVAFLVMYLRSSNVRLFRKSQDIPVAEEDAETDDIFAINYQKEIDKAVTAGNYRLAVRLLFLRLLRKLSEKKAIQYAQGRTNFDYLMQVSQAPWYKQFFRLTRHYEFVWYGLFELDSDKFATIKNDFNDFEHQL